MYVDEVTRRLGISRSELARRLGFRSPGTVSNWVSRHGGLIPELYARRLQEMERRKLRFDPTAYE